MLGEALERRTIGSLALAVGGIALIAARGIGHLDRVGLAEALLAAISFAALVLAGKRLRDFYEPSALVAWQLGTAAVLLLPALASASPARVWHAAPTLLALGVVHTGIAGILYFRALGVVRAQHAGILAYLEPATAVVYAWIFLGETPGWQTLLGGVLIIGAGVNIVLGARRRSGVPVAAPEAAA